MTKYISQIETVEEGGNTGIKITVSEEAGETVVRAVNTKDFETITAALTALQEKGITTDNLATSLSKIDVNAATLEGQPSSFYATAENLKDYAKSSELSAYAKTSDLSNYKLASEDLLVGRIKSKDSTTSNWDYGKIEGARNNNLALSSGDTTPHGFCLLIRPGGHSSDTSTNISWMVQGFNSSGSLVQYSMSKGTPSINDVVWIDNDGSSINEKCLTRPVTIGWTNCASGVITFNYHGRSVSRIWTYE